MTIDVAPLYDETRVILEANRDCCDDFCKPVTNLRGLRIFRFRTHQPNEAFL